MLPSSNASRGRVRQDLWIVLGRSGTLCATPMYGIWEPDFHHIRWVDGLAVGPYHVGRQLSLKPGQGVSEQHVGVAPSVTRRATNSPGYSASSRMTTQAKADACALHLPVGHAPSPRR
jgi:hypothetical protein